MGSKRYYEVCFFECYAERSGQVRRYMSPETVHVTRLVSDGVLMPACCDGFVTMAPSPASRYSSIPALGKSHAHSSKHKCT